MCTPGVGGIHVALVTESHLYRVSVLPTEQMAHYTSLIFADKEASFLLDKVCVYVGYLLIPYNGLFSWGANFRYFCD